jgi:hypothetical protein
MNQQTEQGHKDLRNLLLNGRILINGMPLTGNELGLIVQEEQMLYEKASRLDAAQELAAQKKKSEVPKKKPNIIPIKSPEKK